MSTWTLKVCGPAVLLASLSSAQVTQRMSVDSGGAQGNADSIFPAISADGRYVAFWSLASNLVPADTDAFSDVFVRDRLTGTTERVSVDSSGAQANGPSGLNYFLSISADGRYVAFDSLASNLVPGDTNMSGDVFVRDRLNGTTERVSVDSSGVQGNAQSGFYGLSISADGRYVAFESDASNLVVGDTNATADIFVHDRLSGTTERVSVDSSGAQANNYSREPALSADGRYVVFYSWSPNLVTGDTNGLPDIFLRDRQSGTTERMNVSTGGAQANGASLIPRISADGRFVAFMSEANNLVLNDTNGADVFVHDHQNGTTERVSVDSGGGEANGKSGEHGLCISGDGRCVAFWSHATSLVPGDTNGFEDVFLRDRQTGMTEFVSVDSSGMQVNGLSNYPSISGDGRYVAFHSAASNLVLGDTNAVADVFVRDRDATAFRSLCHPGLGGVIACPCSNPPSGPGQGCDNSSATGGASFAAAGAAYVSIDSLVFTTSGEKPTATSILMQGNALMPNGLVFGQGIRCVGGTLKRLYTKTAVGGSISAPNIGAGDPTVSTRSAALGDTIQAGQSRYYLVYYRDPIVLGGCPVSSTFNATQSGQVTWSM